MTNDDINLYIGGAIRLTNTGIYCKNCSFLNCRTTKDGGAIGLCNDKEFVGIVEAEGCIFISNTAGDRGGGINARQMPLKCINCSFLHNLANKSGSAVATNIKDSVEYVRCVFVRNKVLVCDETGGSTVLHVSQKDGYNVTLSLITFLGNVALKNCWRECLLLFFLKISNDLIISKGDSVDFSVKGNHVYDDVDVSDCYSNSLVPSV
jgi:predicted outer membrane repeat protein